MKMQLVSRKSIGIALALVLASGSLWQAAHATEAGDWVFRAGAKLVSPKNNNNEIVSVEGDTQFTFDISYMFTPNIGLELLAAAPFRHDLTLVDGGGTVGSTDHLPPTLSVQYHFNAAGQFKPYLGVGVNWTTFFNEKTSGALEGTSLSLDDSFGIAAQVGVDVMLNDHWFFNGDVRWIDINTDATVNGDSIGEVAIDPVVYGFSFGYRFGR
jgi:outer membrane protein